MMAHTPILLRIRTLPVALLFAGILLNAAVASAQGAPRAGGTISGLIVDAESAQPLALAAVTLEPATLGVFPASARTSAAFTRSTRTVRTDSAGRYRFDGVPAGDYRLHVQRIGYRSTTVAVKLHGTMGSRVSVGLTVEPVALEPVEVSTVTVSTENAYGRAAQGDGENEGEHRLAAERLRQREYLSPDVRAITHADVVEGITLGETDLFRALQRLPGVSTLDDYSAELWTRGAPWDQTRVYFDGLPLFNPLHAMGVFSGINPDAIGAAFLHPGVQPVSRGGGAAGILDLRSRKGGEGEGVSGMGELSLASGRLALDGAARDGRHAWMIAGRRTYLDWLTRAAGRLTGEERLQMPYSFYDLASRYDYQLGAESSLEVSTLLEFDEVTGDIPDVLHRASAHWGGGIAQATLQIPFRGFHTRHTIGYSRFGSVTRMRKADPRFEFWYDAPDADPSTNEIQYYALGGEIEPRMPSAAPSGWSAGYQLIGQSISFVGLRPALHYRLNAEKQLISREGHLIHGALWGERRWMPLDALTIETGLRLEAGEAVRNGGALRWAPRVAARYELTPGTSISAAAGRIYQYTQALAPAGIDAVEGFNPEYLWVLASDSTPAIRSDIVTLGAERWIGNRWLGAVTAYARRSTGVAVPDPAPGPALDRPLSTSGDNRAHGVELSARRLTGRWTASLAYSYGMSEMTAAGLRFPAPGDRRHALDATILVRLGWGWQLGAAYTAASGIPYTRTFRGSIYCYPDPPCTWAEEPWQGEPGEHRTAPYRSLDLLLDWTHAFRTWTLGAYLQVRNALNHENTGRYTGYNARYCPAACGSRNGVEFGWEDRDEFLPGLPTLPVFGFRVAF
jgi:hypothetical protein